MQCLQRVYLFRDRLLSLDFAVMDLYAEYLLETPV